MKINIQKLSKSEKEQLLSTLKKVLEYVVENKEKLFNKSLMVKDDKPHPKDSPEDLAHDVVEEGKDLKEALKHAKDQKARLLAHLRTLKDKKQLRSEKNRQIGKAEYNAKGKHKNAKMMPMNLKKALEEDKHLIKKSFKKNIK